MTTIPVAPPGKKQLPDTSNPEAVAEFWQEAEQAAREEIRRNAKKKKKKAKRKAFGLI